MKRLFLAGLLGATLQLTRADTPSLDERVAALEKEVAVLKAENQRLKESAVDFLSAELATKEADHARRVYRTQVLPLVKRLSHELGTQSREFPREDDIHTMIDAYRPFIELIADMNKTISGN